AARGDGEPDVALLDQILHRRAGVAKFGRDLDDEPEVRMDQGSQGGLVLGLLPAPRQRLLLFGPKRRLGGRRLGEGHGGLPFSPPFVQPACLLGERARSSISRRKSASHMERPTRVKRACDGSRFPVTLFDTPGFPKVGKKVLLGPAKN